MVIMTGMVESYNLNVIGVCCLFVQSSGTKLALCTQTFSTSNHVFVVHTCSTTCVMLTLHVAEHVHYITVTTNT